MSGSGGQSRCGVGNEVVIADASRVQKEISFDASETNERRAIAQAIAQHNSNSKSSVH